jgi:hypothetical protein
MSRQFKGTSKPQKLSVTRNILFYGGSRLLSLSRFIPRDWSYVRITEIKKDVDVVELKIECLLKKGEGVKWSIPSEKLSAKSSPVIKA